MTLIRSMCRIAAVVLALGAPMALAAGGGADSPSTGAAARPPNPVFEEGRWAIDSGQWQIAIAAFTQVVAADPKDADAYNYLGYANRKLGNYDQAFANYGKALAIDPDHVGVHEYIGEAYLEVSNLAKAEEHLKRLDRICLFGCKEYTELKTRVAQYKAKKS